MPSTVRKTPPAARPRRPGQARGAVRLAMEATLGVSDVVEAMHGRIARLPGLGATPADERTGGITGLVYMAVRGITRLSGAAAETLVGAFESQFDASARGPRREAWLAALNGVLGDHLAATGNPLATTMAFHHDGVELGADASALAAALPEADSLLITVHGLCMNEQQWLRDGHDHGAALSRHLGMPCLGLRYNTGRHIAVNGSDFAARLQMLYESWPRPLHRIVIVCHSMGGLVTRSALAQAQQAGHTWPKALSDVVFLGTPHSGAPLERAGGWVDAVLGAMPYAAPLARLTRLRSAGITDLRHGRTAASTSRRHPASAAFPPGVRCFAIAGQVEAGGSGWGARLLGDGLVTVDSALGRDADEAKALQFGRGRTWVAQGINHMDLLSDAGVYARLKQWLKAAPAPAATPARPRTRR